MQSVFTLKQATEITGLTEQSVTRSAQRSNDRGLRVHWERDGSDNQVLPVSLFLSLWVENEAKRLNRSAERFEPITLRLGSASEVSKYLLLHSPTPEPKVEATFEERYRSSDFLDTAEAAIKEAAIQEVRRIEVERDAAIDKLGLVHQELTAAKLEIGRLRRMLLATADAITASVTDNISEATS